MKISLRGLMLAAVSCAALLAAGGASAAEKPMSIPFADLGNIRDWTANSTMALYVESQNRKWYKITFWSPCHALPFAISIAFVTGPLGSLDKYSSALVDGERCWFRTFEASAPPANEKGKNQEK
ncbi:MAG TPA: DUF6491 family protein [Gammaproteobacteria bacterium]|nr:DUF6491 family protein [Gammaproteobacteria bacterium]